MSNYSVYLHIPFCRHRCNYCDFNTFTGLDHLIPDYVSALCREMELLASAAGASLPVVTVYFGGGTPSLFSPADFERILLTLDDCFKLSPGLELSLEANPGTLSFSYLLDLRQLGFNRISLGMQSAIQEELRLLERQHDITDVIQAIEWSRKAGFDNLNLDLIFGLPDQHLETWKRTLEFSLELHPEHFSLYALTLEPGTPMHKWTSRGLIPEPDPDLAADMYELAAKRMAEAGYKQYEISNWASENGAGGLFACRHNLQYWRNQPYLGFGAGAHGYAGGIRIANVSAPDVYIQRCVAGGVQPFPRTPATLTSELVDLIDEMNETMMMGLRLTQEGVSNKRFRGRFSRELQKVYGKKIDTLIQRGLLEWGGDGYDILRLTPRGRFLGNQVFVEFV